MISINVSIISMVILYWYVACNKVIYIYLLLWWLVVVVVRLGFLGKIICN